MTLYLLNSPILTDYGLWRYSGPLSAEAAQAQLGSEAPVSAIGHVAAAKVLETLLQVEVPVLRQAVHLAPGDKAIVLRLKQRLPEGKVLDEQSMAEIGWELNLLERDK